MEYFPDEDYEASWNRQRLDAEWTTISALRELIGIARKGNRPTYRETIILAESLIPELFDRESSLLPRQKESSEARRYRQMAEADSEIQDKLVTALDLVDNDIEKFEERVEKRPGYNLLQNEIGKLHRIRQELQQREHYEQQIILRDAYKANRHFPISGEGRDYREFQLPNDRALRIRVLHPDPPEHSTGADVIYETYWDKKRRVRLAAIQYKVWKNRTLYKSSNLAKQLDKMRRVFCKNHLCEPFADSQRKNAYRLPYCSAFLRPTDKLQDPNARLISSGYHVPVCVVERSWQDTTRGGQKLESSYFRSEAVTHRVFEELFNTNMLGSKWMKYEELEDMYREHNILESDEHIVIHAQEFGRE